MALWTMAQSGMNPVTGLVVGAVTDVAGPRVAVGLGGAALVVTSLLGWRALAE